MDRLEKLRGYLRGPVIADIGTDHGILVMRALEDAAIQKVIATDISPHSLQKCIDAITGHPREKDVTTQCCNGLSGLDTKAIDDIVIAGMGGFRILTILQNAIDNQQPLRRLILSPQKGEEEVRRFLHENGYRIEADEWVRDQGKFYVILVAVPGVERYSSDIEYRYGRIPMQEQSVVLQDKIELERRIQEQVIQTLKPQSAGARRVSEKLRELQEVQYVLHRRTDHENSQ